MSSVGDKFLEKVGPPNPSAPGVFSFGTIMDRVWNRLADEIKAGWYLNRFLYLFGEGIEELNQCLDYWSFLFKEDIERKVLGRNAYGALVVVENPTELDYSAPIGILNPINVSYFRDDNLVFSNFLGYWLPEQQIPGFHDSRLYEAWQKTTNDYLELDEILAIKIPLNLGGEIKADNFQIENIFEYYKTTGTIYDKR